MTADEVADTVVGILDKLGVKEACVVGHSYGACSSLITVHKKIQYSAVTTLQHTCALQGCSMSLQPHHCQLALYHCSLLHLPLLANLAESTAALLHSTQ